jgi:NCS2 family nucleobase:cation symporter-2
MFKRVKNGKQDNKDDGITNGKNPRDLVYQLDGRPPFLVALPLGLQHVLTMFVGNLAPVLILAGVASAVTGAPIIDEEQRLLMVQATMFVSGVATLLQLYPIKLGPVQIGGGLPMVMGTSFVFVGALCAIGAEYGLPVLFGATLVGALAEVLLGLFLKPLQRFFPPVVIGTVLMAIGLSLLPVGIEYLAGGSIAEEAHATVLALTAAGQAVPAETAALAAQFGSWQNMLVGTVVILVIAAFQKWGKGIIGAMAILAGIIVGYLMGIAFGMVDFTTITDAKIFSLPIPAVFPQFAIGPIITIALLYIIVGLETMGNVNGITAAAFNRKATGRETAGAIIADGIGCMFASVMNALPNTGFGQNAGIVAMTKVVNRWVVALGAGVLILAGFFPPVGAVFAAMPSCVLGGAVISVFGMIIVNGMKLIYMDGLTQRNIFTVCLTFGLGYAVSNMPSLVELFPEPFHFIFSEQTLAVCLVAVLANMLFNGFKNKEEQQ